MGRYSTCHFLFRNVPGVREGLGGTGVVPDGDRVSRGWCDRRDETFVLSLRDGIP